MSAQLILGIILAYFIVLFIISWLTGRGSSNEDFFIGGKQSPWYLVAFGMIGASLSGVTFISIPGVIGNLESINGQFSYMQVVLGYLVGYFVIATVLMPLYYRLNLTSIYTYLEKRFGFWSYKTGAGFFLISRTIGAAFRLYLVAIVLQLFVFDEWGVPFIVNVFFTLLLILVYTLRGGIKTIVWTDTLQTTFMLLAVFITIYWIGSDLGLGMGELFTAIQESPYNQLFFWEASEGRYFFKQFFSGVFIAIVMTGLDQDMMQKNNSCKNIGEAQKNMFSFSVVLLVVNFLFVGLGALLYIYANTKGIELPTKTDQVFPQLALKHFPPIVGVTFLIGLIAAAYSSADSAITALTTSFCVDFLGFEKKQGRVADRQLQKTRYAVHIVFTFLVLAVILIFKYVLAEEVISAVFRVAGYTYGPLLGLYAFGLFVKNRTIRDNFAPIICIVAPILAYIINVNSEAWLGGKLGFAVLILNGALTFIGLWLISYKQTPQMLVK